MPFAPMIAVIDGSARPPRRFNNHGMRVRFLQGVFQLVIYWYGVRTSVRTTKEREGNSDKTDERQDGRWLFGLRQRDDIKRVASGSFCPLCDADGAHGTTDLGDLHETGIRHDSGRSTDAMIATEISGRNAVHMPYNWDYYNIALHIPSFPNPSAT
ncbi:hypothetical protein VOLCADRAFT_106697 [Volvox carteri f. nagariensis]|uniref:Uncharacterized protein n=1 Tax=Volvox carteri f. nagariensis TaxID=3068 RepID=D8U960_VOLCA|nr:uncharacterized protein VOLCADRAFT_106697 [Volvox carteri f. nagariensis]EFJ43696.1 hypothetical protein VOLCADRAFT_106697 [Volvox carteri f. nagariensis]|eukprot:XP_002955177.1 hypothetical protein VOLCADRAFT_106697 [Volvox carteri f. nagariensis]